jgi:hypothetical protein
MPQRNQNVFATNSSGDLTGSACLSSCDPAGEAEVPAGGFSTALRAAVVLEQDVLVKLGQLSLRYFGDD